MTLSETRVKAILDGTEGVTPGPWQLGRQGEYSPNHTSIDANGPTRMWAAFASVVTRMNGDDSDSIEGKANAAHIANCDPETISALCRDNLALREALAPFATAAEHVPDSETDTKIIANVPAGPHATAFRRVAGLLTAGAFRAARAALEPTP